MIRFGVIGTNWITDAFLKAAQALDSFQLTAVYSRTEEKGREFAQKHGAPLVFTDVAALAQSEEVDAVYIASPNSFHARHAIALMNQGKHVLCEKPLASNAVEVKAMIEAAQRNRVVLMEAMKSTLLPGFQHIQENLSKLGTIRRYVGSYCQYSSRYDAYKEGTIMNAFLPAFSNGALMDLGIYCLYPLIVLFGRPIKVKASGMMLESGVDGQGSVILEYENMQAVVMYSKINDSFVPSEIQGEKGTMIIDRIDVPERISIAYRQKENEDISAPLLEEAMYYETKEFVRVIEEGWLQSPVNSHEHSLIVMEVMDAIRADLGVVFPADNA
ncbi:hypothetical protein A374_02024 [Fictibacillus macauensis ZFHKF-1]|uniref:Uncharacterized protein n=1 Tax=Fictibacillus macauensis ZFHKF-1 TaxID=1196324 RepID=I8AM29_9BACL|nr:Gfo/Idh/MocA family oxidoreductase [Fictibacillus macauensis]EIT86992.1 hypothetical protein A374_02024 [Fictibacillus macauensis ZFHKF-1]